MKTSILVTLSLFALTATVTRATGPLDWLKPDALSSERVERLKTDLSLTSEQESRLQSLLAEGRTAMNDLTAKIRQAQQVFDTLMRRAETPAEKGVAALKTLIAAEAAAKEQQLRTILAVRNMLTPEQQRKAMAGMGGKGIEATPFAAKAARVKSVVEALGVPPTEALKEAGAGIEALVSEGKLTEAEATLDKFIIESKADEPDDAAEPDFNNEEPGATDPDALRQRRDDIMGKAQRVTSIPLLRKLIQAKIALEGAVDSQDAQSAGRVLTWAEKQLADE
jgi:Spy/CpxP family protein refolding chaperone